MKDKILTYVDEVAYLLPEKVHEEWMKALAPYRKQNMKFTEIHEKHKHALLNIYKFLHNNNYKTAEYVALSLFMELDYTKQCLKELVKRRFISVDMGDFKNDFKDHYRISRENYNYDDVIKLLEAE